MTTGRGARATNAGKCFGENAVGAQPDLVIVINDLRNFGLTQLNNAILNPDFRELGYSMKALLVDGLVIYKDGRYNAGDANTTVTRPCACGKMRRHSIQNLSAWLATF